MKLKNVFSIVAMLLIVFLSGCKKTTDPLIPPVGGYPTVTSTDPANSATLVTLNRMVVVTFSEPMDQTTINTLTFTLNQGLTSVPGTVSYAGTTATFTPSANLSPSLVYSANITTGAKNMAGTGLEINNPFSFTTGAVQDIIAPTVN
jgi:hypothetical protein